MSKRQNEPEELRDARGVAKSRPVRNRVLSCQRRLHRSGVQDTSSDSAVKLEEHHQKFEDNSTGSPDAKSWNYGDVLSSQERSLKGRIAHPPRNDMIQTEKNRKMGDLARDHYPMTDHKSDSKNMVFRNLRQRIAAASGAAASAGQVPENKECEFSTNWAISRECFCIRACGPLHTYILTRN